MRMGALDVMDTTDTVDTGYTGGAGADLRRFGALAQGLLPFVLALLAGAVVLAVTGKDPLQIYSIVFRQAFLGTTNLADTLLFSTPLVFTGLAALVAFRAGVFNVGVEGSLYLGAFAAAWAGFTLTSLPGVALVPLCFLLAVLAGGLWAWVPALLKAHLQVDEVVTTFMLNYVAILFTSLLVNGPFLAPGTANSMSPQVAPQAQIPTFVPGSQFNWSFVLAVLLAVGVWWLLQSTAPGFAIRMVGDNARFAAASGISVKRVVVYSMLISGALGGLAGASHVLGVTGRFIDNFSPGYGFQGIAVALLAAGRPVLVVPAAIFFGALTNGGGLVQLFSNVPIDLINVLQGTVMLFATARFAFRLRFRKVGRRAGRGPEAATEKGTQTEVQAEVQTEARAGAGGDGVAGQA